MGIDPTYSGPGRCDDLSIIIIELPNPLEQCGGEQDYIVPGAHLPHWMEFSLSEKQYSLFCFI